MATLAGPITITEGTPVLISTGAVGQLLLEIYKGRIYLGPSTVRAEGANMGIPFNTHNGPGRRLFGPFSSDLYGIAATGSGSVVINRLALDPLP